MGGNSYMMPGGKNVKGDSSSSSSSSDSDDDNGKMK